MKLFFLSVLAVLLTLDLTTAQPQQNYHLMGLLSASRLKPLPLFAPTTTAGDGENSPVITQRASGSTATGIWQIPPLAANAFIIKQTGGGKPHKASQHKPANTNQQSPGKTTRKIAKPAVLQSHPVVAQTQIVLPPPRLLTVAELLQLYPGAVSIAIRFSKQSDFDSAVNYYLTAIGSRDTAAVKGSVSFRLPKDTDKSHDIELLILYHKGPKNTDCIIGYRPLAASITDTVNMRKAYKDLIRNSGGHFKGLEEPKKSIRGNRDDIKGLKAHRAVYEIDNPPPPIQVDLLGTQSMLALSRAYQGIIINPPVP